MVSDKKYKLINNKQHTHKRYVQLQQATKMAESIIGIIVYGNKFLKPLTVILGITQQK